MGKGDNQIIERNTISYRDDDGWEDPNQIDFQSDVLDRRLYLSKQKKSYSFNKIKNPFIRKVVKDYIGEDFFMCSKETQKVMLDWAIQRFYEDEPKRKKEKWIMERYTISEMINGRKGRKGGKMKISEVPCKFCGKKFRLTINLLSHISRKHKDKKYNSKDLMIDKLKIELMKYRAGRKGFIKHIDELIKRALNYQKQIDINNFNKKIEEYNKECSHKNY